MKHYKHLLNFLFTVISIPLVLLIQEFGSEVKYSLKNYLLVIVVIVIILISAYIEYSQYKAEKINEQKKIEKQNERAKTVLTQIIQLMDRKTNNYRENTYKLTVMDKEWPYFYGVHSYLYEVCENLKVTIAKIIPAESSYVDVSLIYKYNEESEWKWLAGKSSISGAVDLNPFINDPETLYNYVLKNKDKAPIFCNDKRLSKHYKQGRRDRLFEGKPSEKEQNEFRRMMAHEIVPYYISIIQTELVALYMRHNLDKVKHIKY